MADVSAAFRHKIATEAAIVALVGAKIYPAGGVPSSAALPYITYQVVSAPRERHQDGVSAIYQPRYQVDCWAASARAAYELALAVSTALEAYAGTIGTGADKLTARRIALQDETEMFEAPADASEKTTWRISQDYIVHHLGS